MIEHKSALLAILMPCLSLLEINLALLNLPAKLRITYGVQVSSSPRAQGGAHGVPIPPRAATGFYWFSSQVLLVKSAKLGFAELRAGDACFKPYGLFISLSLFRLLLSSHFFKH